MIVLHRIIILLLFLLVWRVADGEPEYIFITIEPPGGWFWFESQTLTSGESGPMAINDRGAISGTYRRRFISASSKDRGFMFDRRSFDSIFVPGSNGNTFGTGINGKGHVVGYYLDDLSSTWQSFLYRNKEFSAVLIEEPGVVNSFAFDINDAQNIVGWHDVYEPGQVTQRFAFLLEGNTYTRIGANATFARGINNSDVVVGYFNCQCPLGESGFRYEDGVFTEINVPGGYDTRALDINDSGTIVGHFFDASGDLRGFVFDGSDFVILNVNNARETRAHGIDNTGRIVGTYLDSFRDGHGFVAIPRDLQPELPRGSIIGHLEWDGSDGFETVSGVAVERADVALYRQSARVRDKAANESVAEYRTYLKSQGRVRINSWNMTNGFNGRFAFSDVPIFRLAKGNDISYYYTVEVSDAESTILNADETTYTVSFTNEVISNVQPVVENPPDRAVILQDLEVIPKKAQLVDDLIKIGLINYQPIELEVLGVVDDVRSDPTGAKLEGVWRSVYAERIMKHGAIFAEKLLDTVLNGLVAILGDLVDLVVEDNGKAADAQRRYDNFEEALDAAQLSQRGWGGFDTTGNNVADDIKREMNTILGANPKIGKSSLQKLLDIGSASAKSMVFTALTSAEMERTRAAELSQEFKQFIDSLYGAVITLGLSGSGDAAKFLIGELVRNNKAKLVDSTAPYSYTALTAPTLEASRLLMDDWPTEDEVSFKTDRENWNKAFSAMGSDVVVVSETITAFTSSIADAFGGSGAQVIEALGPQGRATKKVMDIVTYMSNIATFGIPFVAVYGQISGPDTVVTIPFPIPGVSYSFGLGWEFQLGYLERGVKAIYGVNTLPAPTGNSGPPSQTSAIAESTLLLSPEAAYLESVLLARQTDLDVSIEELVDKLLVDQIPESVFLTSGDSGDSLIDAAERFRRALTYVVLSSQGAISSDQSATVDFGLLIDQFANFAVDYEDIITVMEDVYYRILLQEYEGPGDNLYIAERNYVVTRLQDFKLDITRLVSQASTVMALQARPGVGPAVILELELASALSGKDFISASPENFNLTAKIRNLGGAGVTDVSARLNVNSRLDSIDVATPLELIAGDGSIAAMDENEGSGADEVVVIWPLEFTGDLGVEENILLSVELLENSGPPVNFRPSSASVILQPEISLTDADLDGMPSAWEIEHSLDVARNDAGEDADDDGLGNRDELRHGTLPRNPDSDGDGLEDGEEVYAGADGFITNPLVQDTDGDGENDNTDLNPVDGSTTAAPGPDTLPGEPVVRVSSNKVWLSEGLPSARILVTNDGTGILNWAAVSDNRAIAIVDPAAPTLRSSGSFLTIQVSPGFDFDAVGYQAVTVRVMDVLGTSQDMQEIQVEVGNGTIFEDGFE